MECFKCGISGDRTLLFDAISDTGVVKICRKCSFDEEMPIIKKPSDFQLKGSERKQTVYEKLSRVAGINAKEHKEKISKDKDLLDKQEVSLRDIVDRNFESKIKKEAKPRPDLIDNFHWIIMRTRRSKKITQAQFAKAIAEPEAAIKMAEQGIISNDKIIEKIENYLGINLRKEKQEQEIRTSLAGVSEERIVAQVKEEQPQELSFDPITTKTLTISDLQEMKKKEEEETLGERKEDYVFDETNLGEEDSKEKPEFVEKKNDELSQDDIDDILFGRK